MQYCYFIFSLPSIATLFRIFPKAPNFREDKIVFSTTTSSAIFLGATSSGASACFWCMKIVENILSRIGISQRSLARLVNTNHSLLSRYKADLGSLPVPVML